MLLNLQKYKINDCKFKVLVKKELDKGDVAIMNCIILLSASGTPPRCSNPLSARS